VKKPVKRRSEEDLLKTHEIRGKVSGWFFRVQEKSPCHWEVEGLDEWGRRVVVEGSGPDKLLSETESMAQRVLDDQNAS
jgi:hypothetical protein